MNMTNEFIELYESLTKAIKVVKSFAKNKYKPLELDKAFTAYTVQKRKNETFGAYIDRIKAKGYSVL